MKYIVFCFCIFFTLNAKAQMPSCSDEKVVKALNSAITDIYNIQEQNKWNSYKQREVKLLLKNSQKLYPVDLEGFSEKNSPEAYSWVFETRINKRIAKEDMLLCISPQLRKRKPIYVLIYPQDTFFEMNIINLDPIGKKILKKIQ